MLELDLRDPLTDQSPQNALAGFARRGHSAMSILEGLRRAEKDDRVKAVLVRLPEGGVEPGLADELRLGIKHFRASGKPIVAHSQGLYPSGFVTATYMMGAAADELWMQPGASFQVTGLANEDLFFKRACSSKYEARPRGRLRAAAFTYEYTRTPSMATSTTTTPRPTARRSCPGWARSTRPTLLPPRATGSSIQRR